eukprot:11154888-Lingulodinium_polyedra.AAC.1
MRRPKRLARANATFILRRRPCQRVCARHRFATRCQVCLRHCEILNRVQRGAILPESSRYNTGLPGPTNARRYNNAAVA